MNDNIQSSYEIVTSAKIANGLFAQEALLAADSNGIYILDKDTKQAVFSLPYSKIQKVYAQLGELYIKYGFGKMITVKFVKINVHNVTTAAAGSMISAGYHAQQATEVQGEIQQWLDYFSKYQIAAKQTLSPKKFMIISIIVTGILIFYQVFSNK